MGEDLNYFVMAENDFLYWKQDYEQGRIGNPFCVGAQNTCERYLKHVIEVACTDINHTNISKTHSLYRLLEYLQEYVPGFTCDFETVIRADGFYFSARYPGDGARIVTKRDVEVCWAAMVEVRESVKKFLENHKPAKNMDLF